MGLVPLPRSLPTRPMGQVPCGVVGFAYHAFRIAIVALALNKFQRHGLYIIPKMAALSKDGLTMAYGG
jgi:hypothetical protein